jgi:hypothetical protein
MMDVGNCGGTSPGDLSLVGCIRAEQAMQATPASCRCAPASGSG